MYDEVLDALRVYGGLCTGGSSFSGSSLRHVQRSQGEKRQARIRYLAETLARRGWTPYEILSG